MGADIGIPHVQIRVYYYLANDVTLTSAWQAPSGTTNLCLNGHYVKQTGKASVMRANSSNVTLNLYDCGSDIHYYYVDSSTGLGVVTATEEAAIAGNPDKYGSFTGGYLTGGQGTNHLNIAPCGGAMYMTGGAKVTFENVNLVGNNATFGGCFHTSNSALTVKGGAFVGNTGQGSAINADGTSVVSASDAYITHNASGFRADLNNFTISGKIEVFGNTDYDLSPCSTNKTFTIGDTLENTHPMAVSFTPNYPFTKGLSGKGDASNFTSAIADHVVKLNDSGEAYLAPAPLATVTSGDTVTEYNDFDSAINAWVDGSTLKLFKDVNGQVTVTSGTKTLDLNNHCITYTSGSVIIVSGGTLTICDNSSSQTVHYYTPNQSGVASLSGSATDYSFKGGYVTGGVATEGRGGGLRLRETGCVVFSSGTLFGNSAGWGGGIWTSGTGSLTIGGTAAVIGNYSSGNYSSGGGMFMEDRCAVTMTGGSIRHNSAQYSGGGVRDCIKEDTGVRFTMTGGEITGNYSSNDQGNGFCFDLATTFNVGGAARIFDNQGTNDLYVYNKCYLTIVSPFEKGAMIGLLLQGGTGEFTKGWSTYMEGKDPADYFVSNAGYYVISRQGEALISETYHTHAWVYAAEDNFITASCKEEGCTLSEQKVTINVSDKTYDGTGVVATLSYSDDWKEENGLPTPEIVYSGNTNVGTYTASITLGEATATATFKILPATQTDVEVIGGDMEIHGVDEEINAIIEANPTANNVSLAVKLEEKTEDTAASGDEIAEFAENKALSYFDVSLQLTLDSVTTELTETATVFEIGIPYAKVNKRGLAVYSYHDGQMRTFVESNTKEDGTFRVDKANSMVYIYTKTFSTYAIGYTPYYRVSLDLSFGTFEGKVDVSLEDSNGEVVYKLENVDANNVIFDDVPMGQYKAIVSWTDGEFTTSLVFALDIGPGGAVITPIQNN